MLFFNHTPPLILPEIFLSVLVFLGGEIFFLLKCVLTPKDHFERHFVLVHTLGGGGGGGKKSVD